MICKHGSFVNFAIVSDEVNLTQGLHRCYWWWRISDVSEHGQSQTFYDNELESSVGDFCSSVRKFCCRYFGWWLLLVAYEAGGRGREAIEEVECSETGGMVSIYTLVDVKWIFCSTDNKYTRSTREYQNDAWGVESISNGLNCSQHASFEMNTSLDSCCMLVSALLSTVCSIPKEKDTFDAWNATEDRLSCILCLVSCESSGPMNSGPTQYRETKSRAGKYTMKFSNKLIEFKRNILTYNITRDVEISARCVSSRFRKFRLFSRSEAASPVDS